MKNIERLLIANRGEIACRVIRTAKAMGIHTIALYSDADAHMPHVKQADSAIHLPGNSATETYLDQDLVMRAAHQAGADAIHPGYGFLSENAGFSDRCQQAGITFVGPSGDAIRLMGDKAAARIYMQKSGVPVLPGFDAPADADRLQQEADRIGYPLLIKAVAGGGGKGMREVHDSAHFAASLAAAQREALHAFGDDQVLLERYLATARHVEVQVFADTHGDCVYLFERDCSVQRRHQKVVEEAPAPGVDAALRQKMGEAACRAATSIGYVGAGTVEFLLAPDQGFYFMEMNTRLQVEHPVTEAISHTDLVAWQLDVAAGKPLPARQEELAIQGHAMEVRLYAEDPWNGFLPGSGPIDHLQWPPGIRVDTGVAAGNAVSSLYDPMIAKLISHGANREEARHKLIAALDRLQLAGLKHNAGFLRQVLASTPFATADLSTRLLELNPDICELSGPASELLALAASLCLQHLDQQHGEADPWRSLTGWRPQQKSHYQRSLGVDGTTHRVVLAPHDACVDDTLQPLDWQLDGQQLRLQWGDEHIEVSYWLDTFNDRLMLFYQGQDYAVNLSVVTAAAAASKATDFSAPMNGTLLVQHVKVGDKVAVGDAVVTLEAMKMEHTLYASKDGCVSEFLASPGDHVSAGAELLIFVADEAIA